LVLSHRPKPFGSVVPLTIGISSKGLNVAFEQVTRGRGLG
jgi:hypothetical protein